MARLFEQSEETTPGDLTTRIAIGKTSTPTKNITLTNFIAWLNSVLSFLKLSNNLSDVPDKTAARSNLSVYSQTYLNTQLNLKADKDNVLELNNQDSYTPTSNYHPATKLYVDSIILYKGVHTIGDVSGEDLVTVTFPDVGTSNYHIVWSYEAITVEGGEENIANSPVFFDKTSTGFKFRIKEDGSEAQNILIRYFLLSL